MANFAFKRAIRGDNIFWIYIYIYIYTHPKTDYFVVSELFSVARYVRFSKARIKTQLTYTPVVDSTAQPQGN